jgi:hypothetical protein
VDRKNDLGQAIPLFILKTSNITTNSTHSKRTLTKLAAAACSSSLIKIPRALFKEKTTAEASGKTCQSGQVTKNLMKDEARFHCNHWDG